MLQEPEFLSGRQANLIYKGKQIGTFGIVHPQVCNIPLMSQRNDSLFKHMQSRYVVIKTYDANLILYDIFKFSFSKYITRFFFPRKHLKHSHTFVV